jgi:hypothetical protein
MQRSDVLRLPYRSVIVVMISQHRARKAIIIGLPAMPSFISAASEV